MQTNFFWVGPLLTDRLPRTIQERKHISHIQEIAKKKNQETIWQKIKGVKFDSWKLLNTQFTSMTYMWQVRRYSCLQLKGPWKVETLVWYTEFYNWHYLQWSIVTNIQSRSQSVLGHSGKEIAKFIRISKTKKNMTLFRTFRRRWLPDYPSMGSEIRKCISSVASEYAKMSLHSLLFFL